MDRCHRADNSGTPPTCVSAELTHAHTRIAQHHAAGYKIETGRLGQFAQLFPRSGWSQARPICWKGRPQHLKLPGLFSLDWCQATPLAAKRVRPKIFVSGQGEGRIQARKLTLGSMGSTGINGVWLSDYRRETA